MRRRRARWNGKLALGLLCGKRGGMICPLCLACTNSCTRPTPCPTATGLPRCGRKSSPTRTTIFCCLEKDGLPAASVTVVVVKNLTRCARPYAIIENVITDQAHRRQGFAAALMAEAVKIAQSADCYKVSLTTGNKDEGTFRFYEGCGFNKAG